MIYRATKDQLGVYGKKKQDDEIKMEELQNHPDPKAHLQELLDKGLVIAYPDPLEGTRVSSLEDLEKKVVEAKKPLPKPLGATRGRQGSLNLEQK